MDEFPEFTAEIEAVVEQMDDDGPGSASAPAAAPHAEPGTPLDRATPARPVAAAGAVNVLLIRDLNAAGAHHLCCCYVCFLP